MKPINKLTVDLLTEKYVNNGTLESKFKELFDRITVIHGDMFTESMIMELESGTNWNDGNPALALYSEVMDSLKDERVFRNWIKGVTSDTITDVEKVTKTIAEATKELEESTNTEEVSVSDYVDILSLPKILLVGVKPEAKDDFFKLTYKKLNLVKTVRDLGVIFDIPLKIRELKEYVDVLWLTLEDINKETEIEKQTLKKYKHEVCLDLMYPLKEKLLEKSQSGKIKREESKDIYIKFRRELPDIARNLTNLGFISIFENVNYYDKWVIKETDKV